MAPDKTALEDYSDESNVNDYASRSALQAGETAIFSGYHDSITGARILDIGVGGGRTTLHLAPLAKTYVGVDYSAAMVKACEKRFANEWKHASFAECDVRDLSQFEDDAFDVVVFSYNGIDYVDHEGRQRALKEISRVLSESGLFVFSTHNSKAIPGLFIPKIHWTGSLRSSLSNAKAELMDVFALRRRHSASERKALPAKDYVRFFDGSRDTYYIHPEEQLRRLESDFSEVQMYSYKSGRRLGPSDLDTLMEEWVYFAARKA